MRSSEAIVCDGLGRRFGERDALAGLDLVVAAGETVLITGPNGAGKTTLLRILATVLRPTFGHVAVAGSELPAGAAGVRRAVGYAGHDPFAYPDLTAKENLELYAALYSVPEIRVAEELDRVGLDGRRGDRAAELSRGMLQRLALARVGLHRPSIVLLDEPTAGLDAEGRDVLRRFLAEPGRTIVVATHEPEWFDGLGGRVVAMAAGKLAA
jgi:heme ABC exporter ATP-binding subunit CcmA